MSRFVVFLALVLSWISSAPAGASTFAHEPANLPDLPTTLAEKAARAIYPGPVQWVFGIPEATDESGLAGFLTRLRSFFAGGAATRWSSVSAFVGHEPERSDNAAREGSDAPLPVTVLRSAEHKDVIDIFLGVNLQFFLSRLFSVVLKVNEDALSNGSERNREEWRAAYLGGGGASLSSSRGAGFGTGYSYPSYDAHPFTVPGGPASPVGRRERLPYLEREADREHSLLVEVRERMFDILFSPLLAIGLFIAVLIWALWSFRARLAAEWNRSASDRAGHPRAVDRPPHQPGAAGSL